MRPGTLIRWHALKPIFKAQITGDETILDIGGCDGIIANNLNNLFQNMKTVVIDNDFSELEKAKKKRRQVVQASIYHLPIKRESADMLFALDVLEHLGDEHTFFREISRILKNNGKIILTTPMKNGVSFPFLSKRRIDEINRSWGHEKKGYSREQLEIFFNASGFIIEKNDGYFNSVTRLLYRFAFISRIPMPGLKQIFRLVILLEPFLKFGIQEHIIIGKKVS